MPGKKNGSVGQDFGPSFGSRDRVQTSHFWSNLTFKVLQSAGVTLKMRSRSPKSKHFFPMSHWCFCVSLVKIHQLVQEVVQTRFIFSLHSVVTLKIKSRPLKSNSFNYPSDTIQKVWPESTIWFKR